MLEERVTHYLFMFIYTLSSTDYTETGTDEMEYRFKELFAIAFIAASNWIQTSINILLQWRIVYAAIKKTNYSYMNSLNKIWIIAQLSKYGKQNRLHYYLILYHSREREKLNNVTLGDEHLW